jgi:hypothetical protein
MLRLLVMAAAAVTLLGGCATPYDPQFSDLVRNQYEETRKQNIEYLKQNKEMEKEEACEVLVGKKALEVALRRQLGETSQTVLQHCRAELVGGEGAITMPSVMTDAALGVWSRIIADVYAMPEPLKADAVENYSANVKGLCVAGDPGYDPSKAPSAHSALDGGP